MPALCPWQIIERGARKAIRPGSSDEDPGNIRHILPGMPQALDAKKAHLGKAPRDEWTIRTIEVEVEKSFLSQVWRMIDPNRWEMDDRRRGFDCKDEELMQVLPQRGS